MFVRTERLFLRPAWAEDAPQLTRAIGSEAVVRNLATVPWPYREEHARAWIATPRDVRAPSLLVTLPEQGGAIIGGCSLHPQGAPDDNRLEVGYWIAPVHWGRGYATEALAGMLKVARTLGHCRLHGRHAAENPASGRVLRKLGFRPTGRQQPFDSLGRGALLDAPEYVLDLCEMEGPQDAPEHAGMKQAA